MELPSDPVTDVCGGCHVEDSRLRVKAEAIRFYNSNFTFDDVWVGNPGSSYTALVQNNMFEDPQHYLNVFFLSNNINNVPGAFTANAPSTYQLFSGSNSYIPYIVTKNIIRLC